MTWILTILIALAIWHFIYEGIVAPSIRIVLRNRVFALRDRLRRTYLEDDRLTREVFDELQELTNNAIAYMHLVRLSTLAEIRRAVNDPELREHIQRRENAIRSCPIEEIKEMDRELARVFALSVAANSGGWLVWLVPIAFALWCSNRTIDVLRQLLLLPPRDAQVISELRTDVAFA